MNIEEEIHQSDLGYRPSDRIATVVRLLTDIQDLDIVDAYAADEYIDDAIGHLGAAQSDIVDAQEAYGPDAFDSVPDYPRPGTFEWSMYVLDANPGQRYAKARYAHRVARPVLFAAIDDGLLAADWDEVDIQQGKPLNGVAQPSSQRRGITTTAEYVPLVTYAELSGMLVEAVGEESSDYTAGGHGFTADGRHKRNLETLRGVFEGRL